jgi:DNA repair protein RadC
MEMNSLDPVGYNVDKLTDSQVLCGLADDADIIAAALDVLSRRVNRGSVMSAPEHVKTMLRLKYALVEREVFSCMFLDAQHRLIDMQELFKGTINSSSVYPREVVKAALSVNASAVIFAHNHPSGLPEPSEADKRITLRLRDALALVDIQVLDHIVVGVEGAVSFAERGLL